jgi:transcriptional regulator with XRE-family HTH domain
MTLGQLLRKARERLGKKQSDIAADLECTQPTVSAWETDDTVPDTRDLRDVSWAYGLSVDELLACEMPRSKRRAKRSAA